MQILSIRHVHRKAKTKIGKQRIGKLRKVLQWVMVVNAVVSYHHETKKCACGNED